MLSHHEIGQFGHVIDILELILEFLESLLDLGDLILLDESEHTISDSIPIDYNGLRESLVGLDIHRDTVYYLLADVIVDDLLVHLRLVEHSAVVLAEVFVHSGA